MHFRERNHTVQIIRTNYDAKTKKGKNEIVGRIPKAKPEVNEKLAKALSPAELKEVQAWLEQRSGTDALKRELAARSLPEQMALAAEWFANNKTDQARMLAASLFPAWVALRVRLKKSGLIE